MQAIGKITLKMNQQQLESLFETLQNVIMQLHPESKTDKLIEVILIKIYRKLRNKIESPSKVYKFKMLPEEALAFCSYFEQHVFDDDQIYERTLIDSQVAQIDREYA